MKITYPCTTCGDCEHPCDHYLWMRNPPLPKVYDDHGAEIRCYHCGPIMGCECRKDIKTKLMTEGAKSKADTTNPKDLLGAKKVSLTSVPPIAIAHESIAMMDGATKYGPYNWRDKKVQARIYVDAALRHITSWFEGEEYATDSGVHHLGHARACLGILLDALTTGNLIDDRPIKPESTEAYVKAVGKINDLIKSKAS